MSGKRIVVPFFPSGHAPFLRAALAGSGMDVEFAVGCGDDAVHCGLSLVNNDACYAAIMAVGRARIHLDGEDASGNALRPTVAVPSLCVRCRADDMACLTARALDVRALDILHAAADLPSPTQRRLAAALLAGDAFMQADAFLRPRLAQPRLAEWRLRRDALRQRAEGALSSGRPFDAAGLAGDLDKEAAPFVGQPALLPTVGVVGSAPAVFDARVNADLVAIIEAEGCEAVLPLLSSFVAYALREKGISCELGCELERLCRLLPGGLLRRFCVPLDEIQAASRIVMPEPVSCGCGWLLSGQVLGWWDRGIANIAHASVFGCLAGHVVGQGVLKRIRGACPGINVASVEYDPGTSAVNQVNRLKLLSAIAKRRAAESER